MRPNQNAKAAHMAALAFSLGFPLLSSYPDRSSQLDLIAGLISRPFVSPPKQKPMIHQIRPLER